MGTETACSNDEVSVEPLPTSCSNQICFLDKHTSQQHTFLQNINTELSIFITVNHLFVILALTFC